MLKLAGGVRKTPTIEVGDEVIIGFNQKKLQTLLGL